LVQKRSGIAGLVTTAFELLEECAFSIETTHSLPNASLGLDEKAQRCDSVHRRHFPGNRAAAFVVRETLDNKSH
jgi:hypothetical protein